MTQILYTTPELRYPARGGPWLRVKNSIIALNKVSDLHVISRAPLDLMGGTPAQEFYENHCYNFAFSPSATRERRTDSRLKRIQKKLLRRDDAQTRDAEYILRYAREHSINIVWFGYGNISFELLRAIRLKDSKIKVVCDTDSVWSRFVLRELPYEHSSTRKAQIREAGNKKEREERLWVNLADITTAVSEIDAAYYRALAEESNRIMIFSNAIDLDEYVAPAAYQSTISHPCIYLAGTFWPNSPMDKGARWVIERVLPVLQKKIPNIHLMILGSGSTETLSEIAAPNVTIAGKVKTVLPYLYNADVSIVPLFFESGTRFKILEAGACGIPVVSTTLGAEGIPATHGKDILIADSPTDFAESIMKLINDKVLSQEIAHNLQTLVQDRFSIASLQGEAEQIIRVLK